MKAFTFYTSDEFNLRYLYNKIIEYGKVNCDFATFSKLYKEWQEETFSNIPENDVISNIFLMGWFENFILYLANKEI